MNHERENVMKQHWRKVGNRFILLEEMRDTPSFLQEESWQKQKENMVVVLRCQSQSQVSENLPLFCSLPIPHRQLLLSPLVEPIYLGQDDFLENIEMAICRGEEGERGRICEYPWILDLRRQCVMHHIPFRFDGTGSHFKKDGVLYDIPPEKQKIQAKKSGLDYFPTEKEQLERLFLRLAGSSFRSRFHLRSKDKEYLMQKGEETIFRHGEDFIRQRLAPATPYNDGNQTPMKGHPVFLAQHATGTCCRGCLEKWHHIPKGVPLTLAQQSYVMEVIWEWIRREMEK